MRLGWNVKETSVRIRGLAKVAVLLTLAVYTVIYLVQPFSDIWNTILSNLFLVIAASFAAGIATMVWACYDETDVPRHVWRNFAIGLWLWTAAELIWGYLNVTQGEVPEGISDVFWVAAYFFFGQALFFQYRLLVHLTKRELWSRVVIAILCLLTLNLLIYRALTSNGQAVGVFDAALNSFYPAADLVLALLALWLVNHFTGGAFSRPWLGLLAFAFADLLYAWIEISGLYSWSVDQSNLLSTAADVVYLGAYLLLGLGILSHWVFLKYGLRSPTVPR